MMANWGAHASKFAAGLAAVFLAVGGGNAYGQLELMAPDGYDLMVSIDAEAISKLSLVQEQINDEEHKEFMDILAKHNIKPEGLLKRVVVFGDLDQETQDFNGGGLVETAVEESKVKDIFTDFTAKQPGATLEQKQVGGRNFHVFKPGEFDDSEMVFTYLKANTVLVADSADKVSALLAKIDSGPTMKDGSPAFAKVKRDSTIWGFYAPKNPPAPKAASAEDGDDMFGGNPMDSIIGGSLSLNLGADESVDLALSLDTKADADAQKMAMQAQFMMMMVPMAFQQNPELGLKMTQAIAITPQGKSLNATVKLDKALIDGLKAFAESQSSGGFDFEDDEVIELEVEGQ